MTQALNDAALDQLPVPRTYNAFTGRSPTSPAPLYALLVRPTGPTYPRRGSCCGRRRPRPPGAASN
jgi:hypothetical protein